MAELVDALGLGSSVLAMWRFKSSYRHSNLLVETMSLLSKRDREITVRALEYYNSFVKNDSDKAEINTLINWIKLEQYKKGD